MCIEIHRVTPPCVAPPHLVLFVRYNALFHVLLGLRRTQMSLDQSWALLLQHRSRYQSLRSVWELRTHMAFLINNLQYYVQVGSIITMIPPLWSMSHDTMIPPPLVPCHMTP